MEKDTEPAVHASGAGAPVDLKHATLELPPAPSSERGAVKAWEQPVTMLTYAPGEPDRNPLFLEKRVYQGSNGKVYPLPVIDSVATEPAPRDWQAVHLENEFLRMMVLPEIGGRIHIGFDKTTRYDFFYRQNVIKPALVGLAGPWASGGVEFNWPQHHRPATFMPVEVCIERGDDDSVTVWCSDHDPMAHMKGMHGLCLYPGRAYVELRVRLYNRTMDEQSFLWWANVATHAHDRYQSFFPRDARFAADHAKRAITEYPLSQSVYYGIDYAERARTGIPASEAPATFVPDGSYPPNDLGWYANIPVPTSYMIVGSRGDFLGGYDHRKGAGTVAIADHHIAPGKKQWTWGNHEFGYAWDRNLTQSDGPYVELMTGVYTENQPDFSFLAPGETKTFSQYWYPIGATGVPDLATLDAALRLERAKDNTVVHLQVTRPQRGSTVIVQAEGVELGRWSGDLFPGEPVDLLFAPAGADVALVVHIEQGGECVLRYAPAEIVPVEEPTVATEPPLPADVPSSDELYWNGVHLEQYRHPTRAPEDYWHEALRRDPRDSRCNHALGRWHLRRGEFEKAELHLAAAIARITVRNPNPPDGEPFYTLGLCRLYQGRTAEAYDAFYKSTWNAGLRAPGYLRLAEIACGRSEWRKALEHVERSLRADADNLNARCLKAIVLRRLNRQKEADALLHETLGLDPLDVWARFLLRGDVPANGQAQLDLGFDLQRAGLLEDSLRVFAAASSEQNDGTAPLLLYAAADALARIGKEAEAANAFRDAALASPDYVFPNRLEEQLLLHRVIAANPDDAHAPYFLGNLLYDRRRHREAIAMWERSAQLDPAFPTVWRNLGFAYQNVLGDTPRALTAFAHARELAPNDARILYEQDQLFKRIGRPLQERLLNLEANGDLLARRDDLSAELAAVYNSLGEPERALRVLTGRRFQPWEGGEGVVLTEYVRAHVLRAQRQLTCGQPHDALASLQAALHPPENLSEARHLLLSLGAVDYWLGEAYAAVGDNAHAREHWTRAAEQKGDFRGMEIQTISETTYWSALALAKLGRTAEAQVKFAEIVEYAATLEQRTPTINYFATSLPTMLLFEEDLKARQTTTARFLEAQGRLGLGERGTALRLLGDVQASDRSHAGAIDLLRTTMETACTVQ